MNTKILLIVDPQYDFLEGGNLAVDGATKKMDELAKFISENGLSYDKILLTADWHPYTHCSFKDNGGVWPEHCVQFTRGASIYQPIINALDEIKCDYSILTKGTNEDHEEYSVFKNENSASHFIKTCDLLGITDIDVVGIALDYCVADSIRDGLRALPNVKFHLLKDFCPAITKEGENDFIKFIENTERICLG